jgi:hypothetical protein
MEELFDLELLLCQALLIGVLEEWISRRLPKTRYRA